MVNIPQESQDGDIPSVNTLSSELINLVYDDNLKDILIEVGEVFVDSSIQDELIKDIPFLSTLSNLFRFGMSIRDRLFYKKVIRFLNALEDIPKPDRKAFREKMENNPRFRQRVGENLILRLERLDDMEKPNILGKAFEWKVRGQISEDDYKYVEIAIDRLALPDLISLVNFPESAKTGSVFDEGGIHYYFTEVGKSLKQILIESGYREDSVSDDYIFTKDVDFSLAQTLASSRVLLMHIEHIDWLQKMHDDMEDNIRSIGG